MGAQEDWGRLEVYEGRGIWVPNGMTADEIAEGARALSERFHVDKHTARMMAVTLLEAIRSDRFRAKNPPAPHRELSAPPE